MFENLIENFLYTHYFGKIATLQQYCSPDENLVAIYIIHIIYFRLYYFSAECQGLECIWFCAQQYFVSTIFPEFDFAFFLCSWGDTGGKIPDRDAALAL